MQTEEVLLAPQRYQQDGFYICTDPLIPLDLVERAVSGMDAVRAGNYDTGFPRDPRAGIQATTPMRSARSRNRRSPIELSWSWSHTLPSAQKQPR